VVRRRRPSRRSGRRHWERLDERTSTVESHNHPDGRAVLRTGPAPRSAERAGRAKHGGRADQDRGARLRRGWPAGVGCLVEIWQANSHGRYNHPLDRRDLPLDPAFTGFGRSGSDDEGRYWFETIKPGAVPFDGERMQAPHLSVTVMSRGMLNHAATRLYFADDPANDSDPVLGLVPASRRETLLAKRDAAGGSVVYRLDIVLQGRGETVFFNI